MASSEYRECIEPLESAAEGVLRAKIEEKKAELPTALAIFTDKAVLATTDDLLGMLATHLPHLLEVRQFGASAELHAVRTAMGEDFAGRYIRDGELADDAFFNERQFLDIARNDAGHCTTIGGGTFDLPAGSEDATHIEVRNYIEYDADGLAQIVDFRIVGLE